MLYQDVIEKRVSLDLLMIQMKMDGEGLLRHDIQVWWTCLRLDMPKKCTLTVVDWIGIRMTGVDVENRGQVSR